MQLSLKAVLALGVLCTHCAAQTFQRLGTCPTLGCILPPDQADFLPGQKFDIRVEVHAPLNGSEAISGYTTPDANFTLTIGRDGGSAAPATAFFNASEPQLETWNFTWYEDLFAQAAHTPSQVRVAAKAWRNVALYQPGQYIATLKYRNGSQTTLANWTVRDIAPTQRAKNVIMFIGDGMTTNMITGMSPHPSRSVPGTNILHSCSSNWSPVHQWQISNQIGHG